MLKPDDVRAQFHQSIATWWLRLRLYGAAGEAYERALRIRPDDRHAQFRRAWCLLHVQGRRGDGIEAFQRLLTDSPSAFGFFVVACALQKESRHEEAVDAFREAARLESPGSENVHFNCARSLAALRRFDEAADAYGQATRLNPSHGDAWGGLGVALAETGRWKDAAPCQERALRLVPSVRHGVELGDTLYELNRLDEAERVLRDVLVRDPGCAEARDLLARVLTGLDRHDEAVALARERSASETRLR